MYSLYHCYIPVRDLLGCILVPEPHKRSKLSELRQHAWLQGPDSGPQNAKMDHAVTTAGASVVCNNNIIMRSTVY